MTGAKTDKSKMVFAGTDYAESRSQANTVSLAQNEATVAAVGSEGRYPGAAARTASNTYSNGNSISQNGGVAPELPVAAFRTAAVATTDTANTAAAVSASEAMLLSFPANTPGTARGSQWTTFTPDIPQGIGATKQVQTASISTGALLPNNALSISDMGNGPNAVAMAGNAVASSYAGDGKTRR